MDTQTCLPASPRIVVIGDIHGDLGRLSQILYGAQIINRNLEWIAEPKNTIVVQLGDQVDSMSRAVGEVGNWEKVPDTDVLHLMEQLDGIARPHGGRVLSLLGNHEWMNVMGDFSYVSEFSKRRTDMRAQKFGPNGVFGTILAKRSVVLKVGDVLFCHGGLLPHHLDMVQNNIHMFNEVSRKCLRGIPMTQEEAFILTRAVVGEEGITWTRMYMNLLNEPEKLVEVIRDVLIRTQSKFICVGHNTVDAVTPILGGALWLVDNGISRAYGRNTYQFLEILQSGEETSFRIQKIDPY